MPGDKKVSLVDAIYLDVETEWGDQNYSFKVWKAESRASLVTDKRNWWSYALFSRYGDKQYPDRKFMYSILVTLRFEQLKTMVEGARTNRSITEEEYDDNFVHIEANLYKEISNVLTQKSKISQSFL